MGTTSNHHSPYVLGYTSATMVGTMGSQIARWSQSRKANPSSDCRLKFADMKSELLVIVDQQAAVNTFSSLVHTACQVTEVGLTRRVSLLEHDGRASDQG